MSATQMQPVFYIPHGGGPCFFMDWNLGPADTWDAMADWLSSISKSLPELPRAIVVISAHWETSVQRVTSNQMPNLIYDYYGFPAHTYELKYPVSGDAALASRIAELLSGRGLEVELDPHRGLDHGVFIPFMLIYPEATIPIVQISLLESLDPAVHISVGEAISPLREEGVLIVGSGLSSHNLELMMHPDKEQTGSVEFNRWLVDTCLAEQDKRNDLLVRWENAPAARETHPREDHLLPLMVAAGAAASDTGRCVFQDKVMGATVTAIRFG